jgi:hypothetical protein
MQVFGAPMAEWLARPGLSELQADLFAPTASVHDLVAPEGVAPLLESGSDQQRWSLLVLALWAEFQRTTPR